MHKRPIDLIDKLPGALWDAIDAWAAIPTTAETLEARIAAAGEVERVVSDALKIGNLINARMAMDMLAHRLRDGGPETPRDEIRKRVTFAAEQINAVVPRSFLR